MRNKIDQQQELINDLTKNNKEREASSSILDDENALNIIELTLFKYQKFLDFLKNAGFGKLIEMNEMSQLEQFQQQEQQKQNVSSNQDDSVESLSSKSPSRQSI